MNTHTSDLIARFLETRQATENLIASLSPEDCQAQSMPDASPAKWHLAHVTWFFETLVLKSFEPEFKPWNAQFQMLFNSYYNAVGDKHPRPLRGVLTRPPLHEVIHWRKNINERITALLRTNDSNELAWIVELGIEHEQQHQELLLTDIKHLLSCNSLYPSYKLTPSTEKYSSDIPEITWHDGPSGIQEIGFDESKAGFHFDNEAPRHPTYLQPYQIAQRLITNAEWLEFVADGGYQNYRWWLDAGWAWVNQENIEAPLYWHHVDGQPFTFTLHGLQTLNPSAPVSHISYFEADAFARWKSATDAKFKGVRLPTEAEWEVFVGASIPKIPTSSNLLESNMLEPMATSHGSAPAQFFGDVWEWTSSNYNPYPGYKPWGGIAGEYNGKFMVNQMVLKGGSCFTPSAHIRASYRNFFPTQARWQMTGLRLAKNV
jgi:ergothioneine biosynthesis protein EgtB